LWLLPLPASLVDPAPHQPLQILDRTGFLLYEAKDPQGGESHPLQLAEVPAACRDALLAAEDRQFYTHHGVNVGSIFRALWQNFQAGKTVSGASTITQQLIRNRRGVVKRGVVAKLREAWHALKLERVLTKDEILEGYINTVYFGHQAYGLKAASNIFFRKAVAELSVPECAFLIGLVQSPSAYDPFSHKDKALKRQKTVLQAMVSDHRLRREEYDQYVTESVLLAPDRTAIHAPHFVFWILSNLSETEHQKFSVTTALDWGLQQHVENSIDRQLRLLEKKNVTSAAAVVLDAKTGDILAMAGSHDYFDAEHDGAVNVALSARQPGSTLKPFTYALAMEQGDTAATTIADIETQFFTQEGNPYIPRNYDYGYHGLVRYRTALANSYNIAAVRVLEKIGVQTLLSFLQSAGLTTLKESPDHYGLALTLGDAEVTLLELASAYGIFPREGITLKPRGTIDEPLTKGVRILSPESAWLISSILSDAEARIPEFGEDNALVFPYPVAAKTGTTRNSRDNWVMGYTPDRIVGVWVGNADNSPMKGTSGITGAGPIFHDVMDAASSGLPRQGFARPETIEQAPICLLSGKVPSALCTATGREWFKRGTEPQDEDTMHRLVRIDTRNGLLATADCAPSVTIEKQVIDFPPELQKWARENNWLLPPSTYSPLCDLQENSSHTNETVLKITRPHDSDHFQLDPLVPDASEKIVLEAQAPRTVRSVTWKVDGVVIGVASAPDFHSFWQPTIGQHVIEAHADDDTITRVRIRIENKPL